MKNERTGASRMMRKKSWAGCIAGFLMFGLLSAVIAPAALAGSACYQHHFIGDNPANALLTYSQEWQGVTHDSDNWYLVQNVAFPDITMCSGMIWRVPIAQDLSVDIFCGVDDVSCNQMNDDICDNGYNHAGDPAYAKYGDQDYVFVPLEVDGGQAAVAVYKADSSLDLVGWARLDPAHQNSNSWLAVHNDVLYAGNHDASSLTTYTIEWNYLTQGVVNSETFTWAGDVPMVDGYGQPITLDHWQQGGAFAENPELPFPLFYLLNGTSDASCANYCGINVFEIRNGVARLMERSTNGSGEFNYAFDPEGEGQEPEGITFWDLDADGRAPGIGGQVHAVLLDNTVPDTVYFKHYRLETDDVPPTITCPSNATVECTGNNGINANDPQLAPFFEGASATDVCDEEPAITNDSPSFLSLGDHEVDFTARDYFHNESSCSASILVQDTQDPTIVVTLDRIKLWPPNHKLGAIHAAVTVTDICDPSPTFVLTSITSNEPDNGLGDGDFPNDIQGATYGTPDVDFQLRSERSGTGAGRTYTIVYTGLDGSGNSSQAVVTVLVPHDQAGSAKSGNGYNKRGTDWLPRATTFDLVILSRSTFDARRIARETAQVGNYGGMLTALQTVLKDANGDRRDDLVVRFSVSNARRLCAIDPSLAFRYETTDGVGYLVPNIFALGSPVYGGK